MAEASRPLTHEITEKDLNSLVRRIGLVFERAYQPAARPPKWPEVERLVTEGYAHALRLEGERASVQRRTAQLLNSGGMSHSFELRALNARQGELTRQIRWLRSIVDELQQYGATLRNRPVSTPPPSRK